ncbi:MAG: AlpA family phage regulatory protein [Hyphomonadaceae bacterium]
MKTDPPSTAPLSDAAASYLIGQYAPGKRAIAGRRRGKGRVYSASPLNTGMEARAQPETRLLRLAEVEELTTLSKSLIYSMMRDGAFPSNLRLSENRVAWKRDAVLQWLATRSVSRSSFGGDE